MEYIINLLCVSILKVFDNVVLTAKSILVFRNKRIASSVLVTISQILFYTVIKQVVADNTISMIIVIAIASGIGNLIAFPIIEKFQKDDVWQNIITSSDQDMLVELANILKSNHVKYLLYDTYNRSFDKSYTIQCFTKSKAENKIIDNFLDNSNAKYLRMINGEEVKRTI